MNTAMKTSLLCGMLALGMGVPAASAVTELESLRAQCAQQKREIKRLEAENLKLRVANPEALPKATVVSPRTATPAIDPVAGKTYTIQQGDMFITIAKKYHVSVESLIAANPEAKPTALRPGQVIRLSAKDPDATAEPPAKKPTHAIPATDISATDTPATDTPATDTPKPPVTKTDDDDDSIAVPPPKVTKTDDDAPAADTPKPSVTPKDDLPPTPRVASPKTSAPPAKISSTKNEKKPHAVMVEKEMTYGEFATQHGTDTRRLNELNGLDLTKATVLAKGAELYVPGTP